MLLPVELLLLASGVNLSPHGQGGALPRISFRCPRFLTGQSLVDFDDDHQALHMCDAVMPFLFAGDLSLKDVERAVLRFDCLYLQSLSV